LEEKKKNIHSHFGDIKINLPPHQRKVVLAGNPNVGKSVFFNALTGLYVDVSNYPGTTLDISYGKYNEDLIIDTPGVYGISSFNDEEKIARDVILEADLVINIVDAVHMERDLFLTQQIIDTGVPVIVVLNMLDEASAKGIYIDIDLLGDLLDVPIIKAVAVKGKGIEKVKTEYNKARPGKISNIELEMELSEMQKKVASKGEALLVLEGDKYIAEKHGIPLENKRDKIYLDRRKKINDIISHVITHSDNKENFREKLSTWMLKESTGFPILFFALYLMYKFIGDIVAQDIVGFTEETIMEGLYQPIIINLFSKILNPDSMASFFLVGEYGVLTMAITYVFGLLLPLVLGFYLFLSFFEDSGYLPRLAVLTDRVLSKMGLNGRAIIPFILGLGCVTLATIVTRLLGSPRERKIAVFLLVLTIPCSAQLGVIIGMLSGLGAQYILLYVVTVFSILAISGTILNRIIPGESTDLLIDIPPLRVPGINNIMKKTFNKSLAFIKEAFPIFVFGALLISIMEVTNFLTAVQDIFAPVTTGLLNLPKEAATAFVMGIIRRDFGAAGLTELNLDPMSTLVSLITITLFVPCIATVLVMFKELSKKEGALIWITTFVAAFLAGGFVNKLTALFSKEATGIWFTIGIFIAVVLLTGKIFGEKRKI
jgi:ferrous iron transport protein B